MRFPFLFPERKTEEEKRQIMKKTDHRESAQRRRPGDPYEEAPDPLCAGIRLEGPDGDLGDAIARDMRSITSRTGRRQEKHRKRQGAGLHSPREGNTSFLPCALLTRQSGMSIFTKPRRVMSSGSVFTAPITGRDMPERASRHCFQKSRRGGKPGLPQGRTCKSSVRAPSYCPWLCPDGHGTGLLLSGRTGCSPVF